MTNSSIDYNKKTQNAGAWEGENKLLIGRYSHEIHGDYVSVSSLVGTK